MLTTYRLGDEHVAPEVERRVLARWAVEPHTYWEHGADLPVEAFAQEREARVSIGQAIEKETPPGIPVSWDPSRDLAGDVKALGELHYRRLLARKVLEPLVEATAHGAHSPEELVSLMESAVSSVEEVRRETEIGGLTWGRDLMHQVLEVAEEQARICRETGKPAMGLESGLHNLDNILNGFEEGLYLLAGPPGMGKTSFALQVAHQVLKQAPAIYVTFENSAQNLMQKILAGRARMNPRHLRRGTADVDRIREVANTLEEDLGRLALISGTSQLTVSRVRAQARRAMNAHQSSRCLVVVDYLQLWAKASEELGNLGTVREKVEALVGRLRSLATELKSPVLALSSQNRGEGDYGDGKGRASLSSLKETGDLEYTADVVMFLNGARNRPAVPPSRPIDLRVLKNRNGDLGSVPLLFKPDLSLMAEVIE